MNKDRRKELREQYKTRKVVGGIYRIVNGENGRFYLQSTDDMQATRNWFGTFHVFESCSLPPLQGDWKQYGAQVFSLEELDHLEKGSEQTREEFQMDLKTLLEMWDEKLPKENRY